MLHHVRMDDEWIAGAVEHPGSLRKTAESEGALTEKGTISESWLRAKATEDTLTGRRARLALTLKGLHHE